MYQCPRLLTAKGATGVNGRERMAIERARVYPNGSAQAISISIHSTDQDETAERFRWACNRRRMLLIATKLDQQKRSARRGRAGR